MDIEELRFCGIISIILRHLASIMVLVRILALSVFSCVTSVMFPNFSELYTCKMGIIPFFLSACLKELPKRIYTLEKGGIVCALCVRAVTSVVSDSLRCHGVWPARLPCPWDSPGENTGGGCRLLRQGLFPTQGLHQHPFHLLHWQVDSLPLCHQIYMCVCKYFCKL